MMEDFLKLLNGILNFCCSFFPSVDILHRTSDVGLTFGTRLPTFDIIYLISSAVDICKTQLLKGEAT